MVTVIMGRNVRRIIESSIILIEEKLSSNSSGTTRVGGSAAEWSEGTMTRGQEGYQICLHRMTRCKRDPEGLKDQRNRVV